MTGDEKPNPLDFLEIDAWLADDERDIRDKVARFVREQLLPQVPDWYERGILPAARARRPGAARDAPAGYRWAASAVAYGVTCLELEAWDSGLCTMVTVQGSLAM